MLKIISGLLCSMLTATCLAVTPQDPKYCNILNQIKPGMPIGEVFLIMGPPHSFGQPPNLNVGAVNKSTTVMQPQNAPATNTADAKQNVLNSMSADPILGAFMNAPPDSTNVLIWNFENNSLNVSVKVKGPTVIDVKTNFTCQ